MRFIVDADLPRDTIVLLASFGHEGIDVRDIGLGDADDPQIAEYARAHNLCILTADWGFSDIRVYPPENFAGIVVLGVPVLATRPEILKILRVLLEQPETVKMVPGRLAIVEKNRIRLRPRP